MTTVALVVIALGSIASLLLYLFQTRWSEKTKWLKKLQELENAFKEADKAHELALAGRDDDALALAGDEWLSASEALAAHRGLGQRKGFFG